MDPKQFIKEYVEFRGREELSEDEKKALVHFIAEAKPHTAKAKGVPNTFDVFIGKKRIGSVMLAGRPAEWFALVGSVPNHDVPLPGSYYKDKEAIAALVKAHGTRVHKP